MIWDFGIFGFGDVGIWGISVFRFVGFLDLEILSFFGLGIFHLLIWCFKDFWSWGIFGFGDSDVLGSLHMQF